jgi:hypothetical protein
VVRLEAFLLSQLTMVTWLLKRVFQKMQYSKEQAGKEFKFARFASLRAFSF